jgi:hypothetical protein
MNETRSIPVIPIGLTLLMAVVSAVAALALWGGNDAHAGHAHGASPASHSISAAGEISSRELTLRQEMRRLWEDHVTWTRLAVISLTTGSPDTQATVARLLRNQADIGNAIKPFYGAAAGRQLTQLLREHITIAADLIGAAKTGDQANVAAEQAAWRGNADEIAGFLNKANPRSWKLGEMRGMLHAHLALTTREVVARLQSKWAVDVRNYDAIHLQALGMADMLSDGLVAQFPARFR